MSIDTKRLIDEYFSSMGEERVKRNRKFVDRKEVYDYERKIKKKLIDMNVDELIQMLKTFGSGRTKTQAGISFSSYKQIVSMFRGLWDYYIDNYEIIVNPWNKKEVKGKDAYRTIKEGAEPLTWKKVENALQLLYDEYDNGYYIPMYVECICLLFYCGFSTTKEIVTFKREMVDFNSYEVKLSNKTIHLNKRCVELLEHFHNVDEVDGHTGTFKVVSWRGSYLKFFVREARVADFNDRSMRDVCAIIVRAMTSQLRQKHKIDLDYRKIYNLGFYDFMCKRIGEAKTIELIEAVRSPEHTKMLHDLCVEYGIKEPINITMIKGDLIQCII